MRYVIALLLLVSAPVRASLPCLDRTVEEARAVTLEQYRAQAAHFPGRRLAPTVPGKIAVLGAGPAGLAMMAELRRLGLAFDGYERHTGVGGLWDMGNPESPAYRALVMNSSKATSFLDIPPPADWPAYLTREQALQYLVDFAGRHALGPHIRFRTAVESVTKTPSGAWRVRAGGSDQLYRAVVVATGKHSHENRAFPQDLWDEAVTAGLDVYHTSELRDWSRLAGKRVVVLGIGNSGAEYATGISEVAARTLVAVRTTPWMVPLYVFGTPADEFANDSPLPLPHWLEMIFFRGIQEWYVGHPHRLGFRGPVAGLLDRLPISDRGIVKAIRDRRVLLRSNIERFGRGKRVYFQHQSDPPEEVDAVVFATGYHRRFPFLAPSLTAPDMAFHSFHPDERGLLFLPELTVPQGAWPLFMEQARLLAAYLRAEGANGANVPTFDALRATLDPDLKGYLFKLANEYHVDPKIAGARMRELAAWLAR